MAAPAVRKVPTAPGSWVYADLHVATGDPASPDIEVPVFAYVTSKIRVTPEVIVMPVVKAGTRAQAMAKLSGWEGAKPPRVELDGGEARVVSGEKADYLLAIAVKPRASGSVSYCLKVFDGADLVQEVPVMVRAVD